MHSNRAARGRLPGLLFVAVASFHFATARVGGPARNWHGQTSEYYALLTDAFLAGQTNLLVQPPAELLALSDPYNPAANGQFRLHDASRKHHRPEERERSWRGPAIAWNRRTERDFRFSISTGA
jgi:hypothetical protein